MYATSGCVSVVLMLVCVSVAYGQPSVSSETQDVSPKEPVSIADTRQGRFLEPAVFGVRRKKYTIGTGGVGTFFRAWRNCIDESKSLATIESEEEQRAVERLLARQDTEYWIAATNMGADDSSTLVWITNDLPLQDSPNGFSPSSETCVSVEPDGEWNDNDCWDGDIVFPYLCEEYF